MEQQIVFKKGVPVGPELTRLDAAFTPQTAEKGKVITYDELVEVIGVPRDTNRFKTVLGRWREHIESVWGIVTDTYKGKGVVFCGATQMMDLSDRKAKTAVKFARKSLKIAHYINVSELDEKGRERLLGTVKIASTLASVDILKSKTELPTL